MLVELTFRYHFNTGDTMPVEFRCGIRMDGSGAGPAFSSPNRGQGPDVAMFPGSLASRDEEPFEPCAIDAGRGALPAGHPLSWGRITAGTVLDGLPYGDAL
jgi:hypothetical protein